MPRTEREAKTFQEHPIEDATYNEPTNSSHARGARQASTRKARSKPSAALCLIARFSRVESKREDRRRGGLTKYRFTGKEEDVEVGLQYFGKRYLNPLNVAALDVVFGNGESWPDFVSRPEQRWCDTSVHFRRCPLHQRRVGWHARIVSPSTPKWPFCWSLVDMLSSVGPVGACGNRHRDFLPPVHHAQSRRLERTPVFGAELHTLPFALRRNLRAQAAARLIRLRSAPASLPWHFSDAGNSQ